MKNMLPILPLFDIILLLWALNFIPPPLCVCMLLKSIINRIRENLPTLWYLSNRIFPVLDHCSIEKKKKKKIKKKIKTKQQKNWGNKQYFFLELKYFRLLVMLIMFCVIMTKSDDKVTGKPAEQISLKTAVVVILSVNS